MQINDVTPRGTAWTIKPFWRWYWGARCQGLQPRVAAALFERFETLGDVAAAPLQELARIAGLEAVAITDIKLLRELSIRLARSEACRRPVLSSFSALVAYARAALEHLPCERSVSSIWIVATS